jgi:hypothetical protein
LVATATDVRLDVYGLAVRVRGDWSDVVEAIRQDFAWFERPSASGAADLALEIERRPPRFEGFGDLSSSFVTPRNVVYHDRGRTIVDYFGRALSVVDGNSARLEGENAPLVHEAGGDGAVAVLLPSGGGKSTLALHALAERGVALIGEDTPLIDRRGLLHPFPLRIGINEGDAAAFPEERLRRLERMEFHPKLALEVAAFADRIARAPTPLRHIVVGRRTLAADSRLEPMSRGGAIGTLFREAVVGVGVYQGMEFLLQRGLRDVLGKSGSAFLRARCCAAGLARARVWRLDLGRDRERNWDALRPLLP